MWIRTRPIYQAWFVVAAALVIAGDSFGQRGGQPGAALPFPTPPSNSPAGPAAYSCGVPATPLEPGASPQQAIFPAGQYPVSLPATSLLGARNDLPNPFGSGVDFGELFRGVEVGDRFLVERRQKFFKGFARFF